MPRLRFHFFASHFFFRYFDFFRLMLMPLFAAADDTPTAILIFYFRRCRLRRYDAFAIYAAFACCCCDDTILRYWRAPLFRFTATNTTLISLPLLLLLIFICRHDAMRRHAFSMLMLLLHAYLRCAHTLPLTP